MSARVFGDHYSSAYDILYGEKDYDAEVTVVLDAIRGSSADAVSTIADWGCGTGAHALRFAEQGMSVAGVDLSAAMLSAAEVKRDRAGFSDKIRFHQGDVAAVDLGAEFDAAVMMFAVLGYQTTNDRVLATLRNVRRHLRTGGVFVADVWYGPAVLTSRPGDRFRVVRRGKQNVLRATSTKVDTQSHVATVSFDLWTLEDDRVIGNTTEHHEMRYFFPQELALFFELAGFELGSLTAFPSLSTPVDDTTWNTLIVAKAI